MEGITTVLEQLSDQNQLILITNEKQAGRLDAMAARLSAPVFAIEDPGDEGCARLDGVLDRYGRSNLQSHTFLVYCSLVCVLNVLHEVNMHERQHDEQGVMTFLHKWLLVVERATWLRVIEPKVHNITHLSAVTMEIQPQYIYSAMWKPDGRRFESCAEVYNNGGVLGDVFPNVNYGLNGRRFLVTTKHWNPFVIHGRGNGTHTQYTGIGIELLNILAQRMNFTYQLIESPDGQWGGRVNGSWNGMVGQLIEKKADIVATPLSIEVNRYQVMDFTYPFAFEQTNMFYKDDYSVGSQHMFVIKPFKLEVWMCIIAMVPLVGLVMHLLALLHLNIFMRDSREGGKGRGGADKVTRREGGIGGERAAGGDTGIGGVGGAKEGAAVGGGGGIGVGAEGGGEAEGAETVGGTVGVGAGEARGGTVYRTTLGERMWESYGSLLAKGMMDRRRVYLPHLVLLLVGATSLVLAAVYTGNLAAMLTVNTHKRPFNSLEELVNQDVYKYGVESGAVIAMVIQAQTDGPFPQMWEKMMSWNQSGYPVLAMHPPEHMKLAVQGNYAFLTDESQKSNMAAEDLARLDVLAIKEFPHQLAFGFQKNSAYTDIASAVILRLTETGIFTKWKKTYMKEWKKREMRVGLTTVSMVDLAGLFGLYLALLLIATLTLILEVALYYSMHRRTPHQQ